jgi:general secretion pathway protein J
MSRGWQRRPRGRRFAGFSLVELLVAVAIFALAAGLAYGGLDGLVRARGQLQEQSARLQSLQFAVGLIERDLRAAVNRPVREAYGSTTLPALQADGARIELSRIGHANALAQPRAEIERVAYQLDGRTLQRLRYPVLDRTPGTTPEIQPLLEDVERLEFRLLDHQRREHGRWPAGDAEPLPRAVELRLVVSGLGELRRLLELPEAP